MTKLSKDEQIIKWIAVKNICVIWANAQRPFDERAATRIAAEFDPDAFGTIQVTLPNGEGLYHCVDGQTRVGAIRSMWGENEQVPCNIINAGDPAAASRVWLLMNTSRTRPTVIHCFNVGVTAGFKVEVGVHKLLTGLGYRVVNEKGPGVMRAIGTCVSVYKSLGPTILKDALLIIQGTWGKDPASVDAALIRGYALLLAQHGHQIDKQRLVDKVIKQGGGPGRVIESGQMFREMMRGTLSANIVRALAETYNRGLRKGRIEEAH